MPPLCTIPGSPHLYGLGIRVSFYLLWFFVLLGERCHERHAQVPRAVELILAYAVFLGLVMAAARGCLFAAEVYIALLLISTTVYLLVPRHTTDLVAWIRPDLGLGTQRGGFGFVAGARCLFVLVVVGLHFWFWGTGVGSTTIDRNLRGEGGCQPPPQVGFAFGPLEMNSGGFRALNVLLMLALLTGGVVIGAMKAGLIRTKKSRRRRRANRVRVRVLRELETFGGLAVACILVAAIELTIRWNGISAQINQATTAAQLIPLMIIIALIITFIRDLKSRDSGDGNGGGSTGSSGSGGGNNGGRGSSGVSSSGPSSGGWTGVTEYYTRPWPPGPPHSPPSPGVPVPVPGRRARPPAPTYTSTSESQSDSESDSDPHAFDPGPPVPDPSPPAANPDPPAPDPDHDAPPPASPPADLASKPPSQPPPPPPPPAATTTEFEKPPAAPPTGPRIIDVSPTRKPRPQGPRPM